MGMIQLVVGWVICFMGYYHLTTTSGTPWVMKTAMVGLVAWGCWFGCVPILGAPDSLPALAFASLVCYVLIRHWKLVQELLS